MTEDNSKHEQISDMVELMRKAAGIDEDKEFAEMELINKLFIENQGLREMLQISKEFGSQMKTEEQQCDSQASETKAVEPPENEADKLSAATEEHI